MFADTDSKYLNVVAVENLLKIETCMNGNFTIDITGPEGQIINHFDSDAGTHFCCRVPSKGVYVISLKNVSFGRIIKCYKHILF